MSFLDDLRRVRESPATAYLLYLQQAPASPQAVHVFLEGKEDAPFYSTFLLAFIQDPDALHCYYCGGKEAVYKTYERVTAAERVDHTVLFFVDKDLSDVLQEQYPIDERIFVTEYYSIENYLVDHAMLRRVCVELVHIQAVDILNLIRDKFQLELSNFYQAAIPIMAWVLCLRRHNRRPNLKDVDLSKMFRISQDLSLESQQAVDVVSEMERMCGTTTPMRWFSHSDEYIDELMALEPKKCLRGKFELWFLVRFIQRLPLALKGKDDEEGRPIKVATQICDGNAIEILGPRLQMPLLLKTFIERNLGRQTKEPAAA